MQAIPSHSREEPIGSKTDRGRGRTRTRDPDSNRLHESHDFHPRNFASATNYRSISRESSPHTKSFPDKSKPRGGPVKRNKKENVNERRKKELHEHQSERSKPPYRPYQSHYSHQRGRCPDYYYEYEEHERMNYHGDDYPERMDIYDGPEYANQNRYRSRERATRRHQYHDPDSYREYSEEDYFRDDEPFYSHRPARPEQTEKNFYSNRGPQQPLHSRQARSSRRRHAADYDMMQSPDRYVGDKQICSSATERMPIKIEVSGFDSSMDKDLLQMYFENTRKSGGGEIEEFNLNPSGLMATISFKDMSG